MSVTRATAGLLGFAVAPAMIVKAFVTPYPEKAATFGLIGAASLLMALMLAALVRQVRAR